MKKLAIIFIAIFGMTFAFTSVNAQSTATSASSATITEALTISNTSALDFGNISATSTDGTVTIASATGSATGSGGAGPVAGLATSAAAFEIEGPDGETINVTVDNNTFDVTHTNGTDVMGITLTPADVTAAEAIISTTGATVEFKFGGTIDVDGGQEPGVYSNATAFSVTVNYN